VPSVSAGGPATNVLCKIKNPREVNAQITIYASFPQHQVRAVDRRGDHI